MAQKELEVILTRQLASYLAMPIFLVDPDGLLVFYNEPAEALLGMRFEETDELGVSEWGTLFSPTDAEGQALPLDALPLVITLRSRSPAHRDFWITGQDGRKRHLAATTLPLIGQADRFLGGLAVFWELEDEP
jgi:PAS domain-containing protein